MDYMMKLDDQEKPMDAHANFTQKADSNQNFLTTTACFIWVQYLCWILQDFTQEQPFFNLCIRHESSMYISVVSAGKPTHAQSHPQPRHQVIQQCFLLHPSLGFSSGIAFRSKLRLQMLLTCWAIQHAAVVLNRKRKFNPQKWKLIWPSLHLLH